MPYLTPEDIPEDNDCRKLAIPADPVWLALISGALTELVKPYNWEQFGALTIEQTVERMEEIIAGYYEETCLCETPGGYRVIRINNEGHIEQLDENGEWVEPTDEYYIPPPDAREESTPEERRCLAAANAENVLHLLYESLSDSWGEDLDENQAMLALIGVFVGAVGFAIAPISWGIYAFLSFIFTTMFGLLEFLIADLWDTAVGDQIRCFLYDCADDNAGVVTFDYQCFTDNLSSLADQFSLTETQLRLYGQISYLLMFIGGVDGLNLAGATTAITEADCDECIDNWCVVLEFSVEDYDLVSACYNFPSATCDATYGSGTWHDALGSTGNGISRFCLTELQMSQAYHFTEVAIDCHVTGTGSPMTMGCAIFANSAGGSPNNSVQTPVSNDHYGVILTLDDDVDYFQFQTNVSPAGAGDAATGHSYLNRIVMRGTGEKPPYPDCEE